MVWLQNKGKCFSYLQCWVGYVQSRHLSKWCLYTSSERTLSMRVFAKALGCPEEGSFDASVSTRCGFQVVDWQISFGSGYNFMTSLSACFYLVGSLKSQTIFGDRSRWTLFLSFLMVGWENVGCLLWFVADEGLRAIL